MVIQKKIEKYFEITIAEARQWNIWDWIFFCIETLYSTVLPFLTGMMFVTTKKLYWLFGLIFPVYLKFKITKRFNTAKKTKKVYVK